MTLQKVSLYIKVRISVHLQTADSDTAEDKNLGIHQSAVKFMKISKVVIRIVVYVLVENLIWNYPHIQEMLFYMALQKVSLYIKVRISVHLQTADTETAENKNFGIHESTVKFIRICQ